MNSTNTPPKQGGNKKHNFLAHGYVRKIKCDLCHEKLWGKEQRCEDCSYHVHTKCLEKVSGMCGGSAIDSNTNAPTFGAPLTKVLETDNAPVPEIVTKCIDQVLLRGMDFEGIYRKSGPLTQINRIIQIVNRGEPLDFSGPPDVGAMSYSLSSSMSTSTAMNPGNDNTGPTEWDIMAVTSVLKQYFRDLPIPLMTFELYQELMDAARKSFYINV